MFKRGLPDTAYHQQAYVFPTTSNKSTHSGAKTVKGPGPERVSARSRATTAATRVERLASPCVPRVRIEAHMAVTSTRPQLHPGAGQSLPPRSKHTSHLSCFDDRPRGGHCG